VDGAAPTTTAKAAIDIFVGLTIKHSLGLAERERASAWVLLFDGAGPAGIGRRVTSLQAADNAKVMRELQFRHVVIWIE
jgi:hypothetical protein